QRCRLPRRLRRRLSHADERRAQPARLACPSAASRPGPRRRTTVTDPILDTPFPRRPGAALKDAFLQEALTIATTKFIDLRKEAFADLPEGEALRDRARAIKEA